MRAAWLAARRLKYAKQNISVLHRAAGSCIRHAGGIGGLDQTLGHGQPSCLSGDYAGQRAASGAWDHATGAAGLGRNITVDDGGRFYLASLLGGADQFARR